MTGPARVLSVRQPWAWSLIFAGKDVENRSRNIAGDYRGPVFIQAGLRAVDDEDPIWDADRYRLALAKAPARERRRIDVRGAIIGLVDLVDVHSASVIGGCGRLRHDCPEHGTCRDHCSPWADGPAPGGGWFTHLVFENPRYLDDPIPWKGGLGLRKTDLFISGDWVGSPIELPAGHSCTPYGCPPGCDSEPVARLLEVSHG